ncbi:MAG: hypothetical protein AB8I08_30405 [Sandaracinaceae bacterium]
MLRQSSLVVRCVGVAALVAVVAVASSQWGCGTVDLGDNIVPPDLQLDEDYFYCIVQPQILTAKSCAGGIDGEGGMCHTDRSALRLIDTMDGPPECDDTGTRTGGSLSADYVANFEAVRFTVQSDPLSSPFYRRPTGLDSHPREIFGEDDECADLIVDWINRGAL